MNHRILTPVLCAVLVCSSTGCANWDEKHTKGTALGGLIGAGAGAAIGAATGSWAWGALIGAGAGALGGYIIADNSGPDYDDDRYGNRRYEESSSAERQRREEADRYFQQALSAPTPSESKYLLQRSLDLYPTPAARNNLGTVYLAEGDRQSAGIEFRKALELDPNYGPARDNLARLNAAN